VPTAVRHDLIVRLQALGVITYFWSPPRGGEIERNRNTEILLLVASSHAIFHVGHSVAYFVLGAVLELFKAEKFGNFESDENSHRECRFCDNKLRLIRAVHFPHTEETVRVFECDCGERTWDD
jgi:hypothetical protein